MYRERAFDFVTVSTNRPAEKPAVMAFLKQQYASNANKLFATDDPGSLQAAWGRTWKPGTPFTVGLAPDGKVLYQKEGKLDIVDMRRVILANLPDTRAYVGQQAYWAAAGAAGKRGLAATWSAGAKRRHRTNMLLLLARDHAAD